MKSYKIDYIGFDIYDLMPDLGSGRLVSSKILQGFKRKRFGSIGGALKYASSKIGIAYRKADWVFETDITGDGDDVWVNHTIVTEKGMKWATQRMISSWRKGKTDLVDLLANVRINES